MRETLKFQVSSSHRFLNLSVMMSGVSSPEENGNGSKGHQQQTSPSKTAVAKSNLSNLFKKHSSSPRHQQHQQQLSEAGGKDARDTVHKETPSKGIRSIGHVNIRLPEVVADCQLNTQGHHISTYQLFPSDPTASLGYRANPEKPNIDPANDINRFPFLYISQATARFEQTTGIRSSPLLRRYRALLCLPS